MPPDSAARARRRSRATARRGRGERGTTAGSAASAPGLHFPRRSAGHHSSTGGPAQQDLFDYKPLLNERTASGPRLVRGAAAHRHVGPAGVDSAGSFCSNSPALRRPAPGQEVAAHHREIVNDVCFIKSMFTEAINHDPATRSQTCKCQSAVDGHRGLVQPGSMNDDLGLYRPDHRQQNDPAALRPVVGSGFPTRNTGACSSARAGRCFVSEPRRRLPFGRRAMLEKLN
jgi:hypothetical protein